ncbi:hypothetical protein [Halorubrum ezzemoulense]|uniref:hypothetical protein n=1 Tax=Halorubrum ezzemoulense TaxID=337243 RepID=UPI00232E449E|nr:hypothetical protein [Halorubrum ezzemoulense]MDB2242716.1 hypothetical protein [Halorubrum ezzemoulense]
MASFKHFFQKQECVEAGSFGRDLDSEYFGRITIYLRPDVVLDAVDLDFRPINSDFLTGPAVRLGNVF